MRFVPSTVFVLLASACTTTTAGPAKLDVAAPPPTAPGVSVAIIVRDPSSEAPHLAALLAGELRHRGISARILRAANETMPAWDADAPLARSSGAMFVVRVFVAMRREQSDLVSETPLVEEPVAPAVPEPSEGFVSPFGAVVAPAPRTPRTASLRDLRLDVNASLRRTGRDAVVARWRLVEGALQLEVDPVASDPLTAWDAVYRAIVAQIADAVARTTAAHR